MLRKRALQMSLKVLPPILHRWPLQFRNNHLGLIRVAIVWANEQKPDTVCDQKSVTTPVEAVGGIVNRGGKVSSRPSSILKITAGPSIASLNEPYRVATKSKGSHVNTNPRQVYFPSAHTTYDENTLHVKNLTMCHLIWLKRKLADQNR